MQYVLCYTLYCSERENTTGWGYSSAGRALDWQSRGQRFDPAYLHQKDHNESCGLSFCHFADFGKMIQIPVSLCGRLFG